MISRGQTAWAFASTTKSAERSCRGTRTSGARSSSAWDAAAPDAPLRTPYPPTLLLELVLAKLAATTLCRQSGLVGGVYAPSLFMGAALGSAYGALLTPVAVATGAVGLGAVAPPQAYALVGMAGVLAGVCRVPLTAILLLFELTGDYRIIVPLMGTVGVASWVAGAADREEERAKEREKQLEAAKGAAGGPFSCF